MTAPGEMIMEQPSADTLKVILSGDWRLGGELPGADKVQQRLEAGRGCATWSLTPGSWPPGTPGC
jgi:hypothetical protein